MSLIKMPDGPRGHIYIESAYITGIRRKDDKHTFVFINREDDPWIIECQVSEAIQLIPDRKLL